MKAKILLAVIGVLVIAVPVWFAWRAHERQVTCINHDGVPVVTAIYFVDCQSQGT